MDRDKPSTSRTEPKKKTYVAPHLVEYGSVAKLTQGANTVGNDFGAGFMNNQCL